MPNSERALHPDYWTRACDSVISFRVTARDKQGKTGHAVAKFTWEPVCRTQAEIERLKQDAERIREEALDEIPKDLRDEAGAHGLTGILEWESLGAVLVAKGAIGLAKTIENLAWAWVRDTQWANEPCGPQKNPHPKRHKKK